jgi:hypothetical protein
MSTVCRVTAARRLAGQPEVSGEGPLVGRLRGSCSLVDSRAAVSATVLRDMRHSETNHWVFVETGFSDAAMPDGPLEFYTANTNRAAAGTRSLATLGAAGERTRAGFGGAAGAASTTDDDATDIIGTLVVDQLRRWKCLVAHVAVVAMPALHQPVVDLVAPLLPLRYSAGAATITGKGVSTAAEASELLGQIVAAPSFRATAARTSYVVHIEPDREAAAFASNPTKAIDLTSVANSGITLVLAAERHHADVAALMLEAGRQTQRRPARTASTPLGEDVLVTLGLTSQQRCTTVLRVPFASADDTLMLAPLAETLAQRASTSLMHQSPPHGSALNVTPRVAPPGPSDPQQTREQMAKMREWARTGGQQRGGDAAERTTTAVLHAETEALQHALQRRREDIAVARRMWEQHRTGGRIGAALHGRRQSVDATLRKVLSDNDGTRRLLRDLLHDIDRVSDGLQAAAAGTEATRQVAARVEHDLRAAEAEADAARHRARTLRASREAFTVKLKATAAKREAVSAAARKAHETLSTSDAMVQPEQVARAETAALDAISRETAETLEHLRRAATDAADRAETAARGEEGSLRHRVDEMSRASDKAEEELTAQRAEIAKLGAQLTGAAETLRRARAESAAARDGAEAASRNAERCQERRRQVADGRKRLAELRSEAESADAAIRAVHLRTAAALDACNTVARSTARVNMSARELNRLNDSYQRMSVEGQEAVHRSELEQEAASAMRTLSNSFRSQQRHVQECDGTKVVALGTCRTCYMLACELQAVSESERGAAADEARMRSEMVNSEREMVAAAEAHMEELRALQASMQSTAARVASMREKAVARSAEVRRAAAVEEEVVESLTEELVRQLHSETAAAVKRLDAKLGVRTNTDEHLASVLSVDASEVDGAATSDVYLQWCEGVDMAREAEQRAHAARQALLRAEHALDRGTAALADDRQLAARLEAALKDVEQRTAAVEEEADGKDLDELQQRHNIETAIRALHDESQRQCDTTEREIMTADAAVSSLRSQLADLRREANALVAQMEAAGEPVVSMERSLKDLQRNNDLVAAQLHLLDGTHVLRQARAAAMSGKASAAATPTGSEPPAPTPKGMSTSATAAPIRHAQRGSGVSSPYEFVPPVETATMPARFSDVPNVMQRAAAMARAQQLIDSRKSLYEFRPVE